MQIPYTFRSFTCLISKLNGFPKQLCVVAILMAFSSQVTAQTFTVSSANLTSPDLAEAEIIFANVDNTLGTEILAAGKNTVSQPSTKIYRRVGTSYLDNGSNLMQLRDVSADFGDYNRDGNLDLAICGIDASNIRHTLIYQGNGQSTGTYGTTFAPINLVGVDGGSVAWGDYDNDGDLDLAVMGESSSGLITRIYNNQGNTFFPDTDLDGVIPAMKDGSLDWGDYDSDGDEDLLLTGMNGVSNTTPSTRVFQNIGNGNLVNTPIANLINAGNGSAVWGDYDNDGDLDILHCGLTSTGLITEVLQNKGNNIFQPISTTFPGIQDGEAIWMDYNTDGFLDIIIAGRNGTGNNDRILELYENNQNSTFSPITVSAFQGLDEGAAVAVGYVNGDQKLDLAVLGRTLFPGTFSHTLYENQDADPNTIPNGIASPPTLTQTGSSLNLTWNPPAGTPANQVDGLSYNLYIGTTTINEDIEASMANVTDGERYVHRAGNIQGTSWSITGLAGGTYFAHVQAVDQDFQGGPFSAVGSGIYTPPTTSISNFEDRSVNVFPGSTQEGVRDGTVEWGDYDNDGSLDLLIVGGNAPGQNSGVVQVWKNNAGNNFTLAQTSLNDNMDLADAAWGDYDNDGDLDLVICGQISSIGVTSIWENVNGTLIKNISLSNQIIGAHSGSLDWGDYDNDGDLDLLITGRGYNNGFSIGPITRIYTNSYSSATSTRSFSNTFPTNTFMGVENGDGKFGDFDNDGWLDFFITGQDQAVGLTRFLYQNNGDDTFNSFGGISVITAVQQASVAWGDINNDGFLDLAVVGKNNSGNPLTNVYQFVPLPAPFPSIFTPVGNLPGLTNGDVAFGDYNDDGFSDLAISGEDFSGNAQTKVLFNSADGLGNYTEDLNSSITLADVAGGSSLAWGDFDNDKKLDIAVAGDFDNTAAYITRLYRNKNPDPNNTPNAPTNLQQRLSGFDVEFTWEAPLNHPANTAKGLTYAIYIDTLGNAGTVDIRSPHANLSTGIRHIARMGGNNSSLSFTLQGLRPGTYNWSVQAIDQDFEGSAFAPTGTFSYELPTFIEQTESLFTSLPPILLNEAKVSWGDYTGDGNLDIAVCGTDDNGNPATDLYEFDNGFFVNGATNSDAIIDVKDGNLDWGDYDNDGNLDLLITGRANSGPVTRIFRNIGGGFTAVDTLQFTGLEKSSCQWADIDNNGRLDFLISGKMANGTDITRLYIQNAVGGFIASTIGTGISNAAIDFGDYNNDGYLDFLLSGDNNGVGKGFLYRNNKDGSFTSVPAGLADVESGALCFGDYNADGFLDIAQIGELSGARISRILLNSPNGIFTNTSNVVDAISSGSIDFGDYNNDGLKDILVVGKNGGASSSRSVKLYRYDSGSTNFVYEAVASSTFEAVGAGGDAAWGDYDSDGKLDVIIIGETANGPSFNIYQNINPAPPNTPGKPTILPTTINGFEVLLNWQPVSLPANSRSLSYNVYLGTSNNSQNRRSAHAELNTGKRKLVKIGQVNDTTTFRLKNIPSGNYFWAVQAIDADFTGGEFSSTGTFTYSPPIFSDQTLPLFRTIPAGLDKGDLAWGDYDDDGDLDLAVTGAQGSLGVTQILQNNNSSFTNSGINLLGLTESMVKWVDVNQDNKLDLFVAGNRVGGPIARVYQNNGAGGYNVSWASPPGVFDGDADWADYDNDGDMDLVMMGDQGSGNSLFEVFKNTGTTLVPIQLGFPGIKSGEVSFVDVDNDGFSDIFATGLVGATRTIYFLKNNGNGSFSGFSTTPFLALDNASTSWADYNNDGFIDLIMCGSQGSGPTCRVYQNNGNGDFTQKSILIGVENGSVVWGDYDNDGYSDIVLVGTGSTANTAKVFRYNSTIDNFETRDIGALPLQKAGDGASLAWGDYNNDGKLDLALLGETTTGQTLRIYENIDTNIPATLTAPQSPMDTIMGDTIILSWSPPGNFPAIEEGFTYNLYIGTSPNSTQVTSSLSDLSSGLRMVASMGNTGTNKEWKIIGLPTGTYYWRVQVVDQDYEGGPWTSERFFEYVPPAFRNESLDRISGTPPSGYTQGDLAFGDYDGNGTQDLIVSGLDEAGLPETAILRNENGKFNLVTSLSNTFLDVFNSDVDWVDYDNDGDLDVFVLGNVGNGNLSTRIYDNLGSGSFAVNLQLSSLLENVQNGEADWADFDHDGDLDLALSGANAMNESFTAIYENVREQGTFVPYTLPGLVQVSESSLAWGDFNSDGYADLALTGRNGSQLYGKVYRNNGPLGGFTDMGANAPLVPVKEGSLDWADFDSDGYQDLLLTGESTVSQIVPVTKVYRYNVSLGQFVEASQSFEGIKAGQGIWADYNDDGYPDFIISGQNGGSQGARISYLYTNNGFTTGTFTRDLITSNYLKGANAGASLAFGDIDGDNKTDWVLSGQLADASPRKGFIVYRNVDPSVNITPDAPVISPAIVAADSVTLTWAPPANIPASLKPGHSYQLVLRNTANNALTIAPMSDLLTGKRAISKIGKTGNVTSWSIRGLGTGTYEWSVQAIGPDLEASAFSAPYDTFSYSPPIFVQMDQLVFPSGIPEGLTSSSMDWGDYDNDGDLDLLISGQSASAGFGTYIYENIEQRSLQLQSALSAKLADIRAGKVAWVDVDQDGWLDISISGLASLGAISKVYGNQTGTDFIEISIPLLPNLSDSDFDWGDYDNDGDLDLLISGNGPTSQILVLTNKGAEGFSSPIPGIGIPQLDNASVSWVDLNTDGSLDILLAGETAGAGSFQFIRNLGNNNFAAASPVTNIPSLSNVSFDCGDVNNDRAVDLAITGTLGTAPFADIFTNDGSGVFTAMGTSITALQNGDIVLGDYTDDDKLDVIISGADAGGDPKTNAFKQASNGVFIPDPIATSDLVDISAGDLAWADYDNDGKLDLGIAGTGASDVFSIFRNVDRNQNNVPEAPGSPNQLVDGSKVKLTWTAPANSDAYTYNISIGITGTDEVVKPGMSNLTDPGEGFRKIAAKGNVGHNLEWNVGGLVSGRQYSWRVQSIGPDFEGSVWTTGSFTFNPPGYEEVTNNVFPNGVPGGLSEGVLAAIDYDQDGDMDFFRTGTSSNAGVSEIYVNNYTSANQGRFDRDPDASLDITDLKESAAAWGDYDNDGDVDLVLSGIDNAVSGNHLIFVYKNEGGRFTADVAAAANLNPLSKGSAELADLDNDGDLDLIMAGNDPSGIPKSYLYENENGIFEQKSSSFPEIRNGSIKSADFDKDGDIDILISGESLASGATTQVFRNTGDMTFITVPGLLPSKNSSADWADYDNDGYLDIIISGENINPVTLLLRYDPTLGDGEFVNIMDPALRNITTGNIMWGDFNNDGWPDIVAHGQTVGSAPADRSSLLFRNDKQGGFTEDLFSSQNLRDMAQGHSTWIDYDNDGQLDILMTGRDVSDNEVFAVFHNIDTITSVQPPAPENLSHEISGATLVLKWDAPASYDPNTVDGLSYNLYFGTTTDKEGVIAAHADLVSGYRKIHARGNAQGGLSWSIRNLPDGEYVWSVQSIDQGYEASSFFGPEQSISFNNPQPLIVLEDYAPFIDWDGANVESSIIIDDLNIVEEVYVYYRGISDTSAFTKVLLNPASNPYIFEISTAMVDEIGVEYYFEVLGTTSGFNAYSDTGYTYINYPAGLPYEYTDMAFGKEVTDYNILSIPLVLSNTAISSILQSFGEYDIFKWRFWHYQNGASLEYTEGLENIETGLSYWLITKDNRSFNTGPGHTTQVKKSDPFTLNLVSGWNQIGNPYAFNLSWNDILKANEVDSAKIQGAPLGYTSAGFQAVTTINKYRGVFVRVNEPITLRIPVIKNNSINRTGWLFEADLPSPNLHTDSWKLGIHMKSGGLHSRLAAIGMDPKAAQGLDKFDWYAAPRPSQYMDLKFKREADDITKFVRDIVPTQKSFIWEFTVNSNLSDPYVELSWNNEAFGNGGLQLILFDVDQQKQVNMADVNSYNSYSENKTRNFKIFFGSASFIEEQIQSDRIHLGMAYPIPAKAEVHLPFSLPGNEKDDFRTKIEVLTQTGQIVATWEDDYKGGFHEIIWNGKNETGKRLSAGLYIYRLTVVQFGKQEVQVQKFMLE